MISDSDDGAMVADDGPAGVRRPRRHHRRRGTAAIGAALALVLVAAGCRDESTTAVQTPTGTSELISQQAAAGDFGTLDNVCQSGTAKGATDTGVTDTGIQVGTITDFGFTQVPEYIDTAEVFTKWCNDAGGINGRKIGSNILDTKVFEYRQRILEACQQDFFLVGGGGAFDGDGVNDRLTCLLPEFPAQVINSKNRQSDLQVISYSNYNPKVSPFDGYFKWLATEKFPETKDHIGMIVGDAGVTKEIAGQSKEVFDAMGATVVYNDVYPILGASDWTPYAQAIKDSGAKSLVFFGEYKQLAKLEQSLTDIGHKLTWIDANSNSYNQEFLDVTGSAIDEQPNYLDGQIYPLEKAADNPATQQMLDAFKKYKPDAKVTAPMVKAWSSWLLFASSAAECGSTLTRKCMLEKATTANAWTGGGLHAKVDLTNPDSRMVCFTVEQASSDGWTSVDPKATEGNGVDRCETATVEMKGNYGKPATLADVGKSMADLK